MYNIWQDAGNWTRVAANAARCATNELHTSLVLYYLFVFFFFAWKRIKNKNSRSGSRKKESQLDSDPDSQQIFSGIDKICFKNKALQDKLSLVLILTHLLYPKNILFFGCFGMLVSWQAELHLGTAQQSWMMADVAATLSTYSCWFGNGNSTCSVFVTRLNCAVGERGGSAGGPVRERGVKRLYVTTFHFLSTWCDAYSLKVCSWLVVR